MVRSGGYSVVIALQATPDHFHRCDAARGDAVCEATVRLAKADIVTTDANLLPEYSSFAEW